MPTYREHFKESSYDVVNYNIYQPIVLKVAPYLRRKGVTPNQISVVRLVAILALTWFLYYFRNSSLTFLQKIFVSACTIIILLLCGMSDDLDGYMARKYNMKTKYGKYVDGTADIVSNVCTLFIVALYTKNIVLTLIFGIIFLGSNIYSARQNEHGCGSHPLLSTVNHGWLTSGIVISLLLMLKNNK